MLIRYMRVSKSDGTQTVDLRRDSSSLPTSWHAVKHMADGDDLRST